MKSLLLVVDSSCHGVARCHGNQEAVVTTWPHSEYCGGLSGSKTKMSILLHWKSKEKGMDSYNQKVVASIHFIFVFVLYNEGDLPN